MKSITVAVAVLLLVALMIPWAAAQGQPEKSDKAWEVYKDPQGLFTLSYPREWIIESSQDEPGYLMLSYSRMDNKNSIMVDGEVYVEKLEKPMTLDELSNSYDSESKEIYPSYKPSAPTSETIGNLQFTRKTFTRQEGDKSAHQGIVWLASKGSWIITISFDTSQELFEAQRPVMEKIARTFVFEKKEQP
jgi:hypothetical protein